MKGEKELYPSQFTAKSFIQCPTQSQTLLLCFCCYLTQSSITPSPLLTYFSSLFFQHNTSFVFSLLAFSSGHQKKNKILITPDVHFFFPQVNGLKISNKSHNLVELIKWFNTTTMNTFSNNSIISFSQESFFYIDFIYLRFYFFKKLLYITSFC